MGRAAGRTKETKLIDDLDRVTEILGNFIQRHFQQLRQILFLRSRRTGGAPPATNERNTQEATYRLTS
jgi:hypothetical protein